MHSSQFSIPSMRSESPTSESPWAISMVTERPIIVPIDADAISHDDADASESRIPWWFPTAFEGFAGILFGATIGLLVVMAVVLDHEDFSPPVAAAPARTGRYLEAATRKIEITKPATAARRAVVVSAADDGARERGQRARAARAPR